MWWSVLFSFDFSIISMTSCCIVSLFCEVGMKITPRSMFSKINPQCFRKSFNIIKTLGKISSYFLRLSAIKKNIKDLVETGWRNGLKRLNSLMCETKP